MLWLGMQAHLDTDLGLVSGKLKRQLAGSGAAGAGVHAYEWPLGRGKGAEGGGGGNEELVLDSNALLDISLKGTSARGTPH